MTRISLVDITPASGDGPPAMTCGICRKDWEMGHDCVGGPAPIDYIGGRTVPLDSQHNPHQRGDDNIDIISAGLVEMREMLDEYKATVERDWALQESHILHGKGDSVPLGILSDAELRGIPSQMECDRRVVARWLAMSALGLASLTMLTALASAGLSGPIEYGIFALSWYISVTTTNRADKDASAVWRIVQAKTGWGI